MVGPVSYTHLDVYKRQVLFVYVTALWVASLISRDAGIVDSFWGLGLVVSAVVFFIFSGGFETRKILVLVLVAVWGPVSYTHLDVYKRQHRGWPPLGCQR